MFLWCWTNGLITVITPVLGKDVVSRGATRRVCERTNFRLSCREVDDAIREACLVLHPELKGVERKRWRALPAGKDISGFDDYGVDRFDDYPSVYVNNHRGKAAILEAVKRAADDAE